MQVVLLRVAIDTGYGGILGPVFSDGSFEYIPLPSSRLGSRTYGNTLGRHGRPLVEYFPPRRQAKMMDRPIFLNPEFETFTYGDHTSPKAGLRRLVEGDLLVFYCGLQGWGFRSEPALYLMGCFEIEHAGSCSAFTSTQRKKLFHNNAYVKNEGLLREVADTLVLVKGTRKSRLFEKAYEISSVGRDKSGRPLKVLSKEMQAIFGDFGGKIAIQRCPPRWVAKESVEKAARFVKTLE